MGRPHLSRLRRARRVPCCRRRARVRQPQLGLRAAAEGPGSTPGYQRARRQNPHEPFWRPSFEQRRCLVPASSYCEPKGVKPATWHWFALDGDEERPLFAPGVWTRYRGPLKWRDKEAWTRAPSTASPTWAASRRTARSTSMPITSGARVLRDKQQMRYCGRFIVCRVPR
jgi:putative SOS response-associated peptidase YedK